MYTQCIYVQQYILSHAPWNHLWNWTKIQVETSRIFEALQTSSAQKQYPLWFSSLIMWNSLWMWANALWDLYAPLMHCAHYRCNSCTKAEWSSKPILSYAKSLLFMHCHIRGNREHNGLGLLCERSCINEFRAKNTLCMPVTMTIVHVNVNVSSLEIDIAWYFKTMK